MTSAKVQEPFRQIRAVLKQPRQGQPTQLSFEKSMQIGPPRPIERTIKTMMRPQPRRPRACVQRGRLSDRDQERLTGPTPTPIPTADPGKSWTTVGSPSPASRRFDQRKILRIRGDPISPMRGLRVGRQDRRSGEQQCDRERKHDFAHLPGFDGKSPSVFLDTDSWVQQYSFTGRTAKRATRRCKREDRGLRKATTTRAGYCATGHSPRETRTPSNGAKGNGGHRWAAAHPHAALVSSRAKIKSAF